MVSNVLNLTPQDLAAKLAVFRERYADDAEYRELRALFPEDWPM
jgi:hypothetical protein